MKGRVLVCAPSHSLYGGVETMVADLCRELPRRGWQVVLALGKGARFNDVQRYLVEYPDLASVEVDGTKGTMQARLESLSRVIRTVRPHIVLTVRMFDAYPAVVRLKRKGGWPRLAVTIRGYEPRYLYDVRLFRDSVDLCVTCGKLIREAVIEWAAVPEGRVVSIPVGVHPPEQRVPPRETTGRLRIGYVGRLDQGDKRVLDLVGLVERLDRREIPHDLWVAGTGAQEITLRERLLAGERERRTRFLGWVRREDLYREVYPNLDCVVNFSATEGVTVSPREAMMHGAVPVVAEFLGLQTEGLFRHEVNALTFPVGHLEAAADNVERLLTEPGLLNRLSRAAIASQTGVYSWAGAIDAWDQALERCLSEPARLGSVPRATIVPDGCLARMGVPPWLAQRIRDVMGRRHLHADPGSEWPGSSGLCDEVAKEAIVRFALECERRRRTDRDEVVAHQDASR